MRSLAERIEAAELSPEVARTFSDALLELAGVDGEATGEEHGLVGRLLAHLAEGAVSPAPFEALWPHAELFLTACVYVAVVDGHYGVEEARRLSGFAHRLGFSAHRLAEVEGRTFRELRERGALARDLALPEEAASAMLDEPATEMAHPLHGHPDDDTAGFEAASGHLVDEVPVPDLPTGAWHGLDTGEVTQTSDPEVIIEAATPEVPPAPVLPGGPLSTQPPEPPPEPPPAHLESTQPSLSSSASRAVRWKPPDPDTAPRPVPASVRGRAGRERTGAFARPSMPLVTGSSPVDPPPRLLQRSDTEEVEATEVSLPRPEDTAP